MTTTTREGRSVYLAFEFDRDAHRRQAFIDQAERRCDFTLDDRSMPAAAHSERWRREASPRIQSSDVVIVLLGRDTHNAPGVQDELNLARQWRRPIVQLQPRGRNYGLVSDAIPVCRYRWNRINEMLRNPRAFAGSNPAR